MKAKQILTELFLDYFNNYLSIEKFASDNDLDTEEAKILLELGKRLHEAQFESL